MPEVRLTTPQRVVTREPVLMALDGVIKILEQRWLPPGEHEQHNDVTWHWVSMPLHTFLPALEAAWHEAIEHVQGQRPVRFFEVGCGIGTKLLLVKGIYQHAVDVSGIDINAKYVKTAFELGLAVQTWDAMSFDGYGAFDIVYLYRPFKHAADEVELEHHVCQHMAPGAVLIQACGESQPGGWKIIPEGCTTPWIRVWQKPG